MRHASFIASLILLGCANSSRDTSVGDVEITTLRQAYANTHVVRTADGVVLVDPGSEEHAEEMDAQIRDAGVDPASLSAIVLTHGHADHAGAAAWFRDAYGTPVVGGAGDVGMFESGHNEELCPTDARAERRLEEDQAATYAPFLPDRLISEPSALSELGAEATLTPLPGHTEGSLVLRIGEAVFIGDVLRGSILGRRARTHFYQCDLEDNEADVQQLMDEIAPDGDTFFTGHFGPLSADAIRTWMADPS
ncbi:MAG: MBL fold metallo-hydrolase [Myxococcales bacterium]|nr:MBL fold metallo-hydrolase [Myxococcales bacterium]